MEKFIILAIVAFAAAIDMDPKCFVKPPYVNPRTCCLDPSIVKDDLHEMCMRKVFNPPKFHEIDTEYDHSEANIIPHKFDNKLDDNSERKKRSVGELASSIDVSIEKEFNTHQDENDSDSGSSSESLERRPFKHHDHRHFGKNHHGKHHHDRHHHGRHHHGRHHHGRHHHGGHHHHHHHHRHGGRNVQYVDDRYHQRPSEYDDTYQPVFHRDFAKWTTVSARFQKLSIYWNCIFNETGIMDSELNVDMSNVKTYLSSVLDENNAFLPIMEDAFETCSIKQKEFIEDLKLAKEHYILDSTPLERQIYRNGHPNYNLNSNQYNIKGRAYFLVRCVKRVVYKNCPDEKFRVDDKLCSKSRAYLKNCPYSARQFYQRN